MIPEAQYNALYLLAGGLPVEEVWAEVAQYAPAGSAIDTGNVVKAMERTPDRVVFVKGNDELDRILEHPFAAWRIFLHPAQRKIAYAPRYAGPAQVTGGAGTGKTVTALHRAAHLARAASEQLSAVKRVSRSVLLTTFTRNLADALDVAVRAARGRRRRPRAGRDPQRRSARLPDRRTGPRRSAPPSSTARSWTTCGQTAAAEAGLPYAPDVPQPRVGAGDPRPGPAHRAGLPDAFPRRAGHAARQGAAPPGLAARPAGRGAAAARWAGTRSCSSPMRPPGPPRLR